jgi:hypothetical protein
MLRVGSKTVVSILERDPRCAVITLDPDTAECAERRDSDRTNHTFASK